MTQMTHPLVMTELIPLQDIDDIEQAAADLRGGMLDGTNDDLRLDFSCLIEDFCVSDETAAFELWDMQELCYPAMGQAFVAFAGRRAVGLAAVEISFETPKGVPEDWPTLWHFIVNPWRGQGIGRKIMQASLGLGGDEYDGKAWTIARVDNVSSRCNLQHAGFNLTGMTDEQVPRCIYTFGADPEITRQAWLVANAGAAE